jgi:hypothetical protein
LSEKSLIVYWNAPTKKYQGFKLTLKPKNNSEVANPNDEIFSEKECLTTNLMLKSINCDIKSRNLYTHTYNGLSPGVEYIFHIKAFYEDLDSEDSVEHALTGRLSS